MVATNRRIDMQQYGERVEIVDDVKDTTLKECKKENYKENTTLLVIEMNTSKNSIWILAQTPSQCPSKAK